MAYMSAVGAFVSLYVCMNICVLQGLVQQVGMHYSRIICGGVCGQVINTSNSWAQLFEGRLALNPGFFFLCSQAFSRIFFSAIFRASNHQLVDQKN